MRSARDAFLEEASEGETDREQPMMDAHSAAHPSSSSLRPADAVSMVQSQAMIVILGLPARSQFGLDYWTFHVGPKFLGMKMIPPGVHFVWTAPSPQAASASGQSMDPDMASRLGSFVWFAADTTWVRRWSATDETLEPCDDEDEEQRYIAGARRFDFDAGQGSYPVHEQERWLRLTDCITCELVERLEPIDRKIGVGKIKPPYRLDDKRSDAAAAAATTASGLEQQKPSAGDMTMDTTTSTEEQKISSEEQPGAAATAAASSAAPTARPTTLRPSTSFYTRIPTITSFVLNYQQPPLQQQHPQTATAAAAASDDTGMADTEQHEEQSNQAGSESAGAAAAASAAAASSMTPEDRSRLLTAMHMDQSPLLESLFASSVAVSTLACVSNPPAASSSSSDAPLLTPSELDLLGEYQFAFTAFLVGQDYEGFECWKGLTVLLTSCADALTRRHVFYEQWLGVLGHQLEAAPRDFFVDELSSENFLRPCVQRLFDHLATALVPMSLVYAAKELRELIKRKFLWRNIGHLPTFVHQEEEQQHPEGSPSSAREITAEELQAFKQRLQAQAEEDEYAPTIAEEE